MFKDILNTVDLKSIMQSTFMLIMINHAYKIDEPNYQFTYEDNPLAYFSSTPEVMNTIFGDTFTAKDNIYINQNLDYDLYKIRGNELR